MTSEKIPARANITDMVQIVELSENRLRYHTRKAGLKKGKDGKYNVKAVMNAVLDHRAAANNAGAKVSKDGTDLGDISKAKGAKVVLECQILKVKLDKLKGDLIDLEELNREVVEIAGIVNGALEEFVQWVTVEYRKAEITAKAKDIRDRTKRWVQGKVDEKE